MPNFTGREEQLQQLESLLLNPENLDTCRIAVLSGSGGMGKSALACKFAKTHQEKFPDGVIWLRVDGQDQDTIARKLMKLCGEGLDLEEELDAVTVIQERLAHRRMLLIFDNAIDTSIRDLLSFSNQLAIIITTRKRTLRSSLGTLGGKVNNIDIQALSQEHSLELLKKILDDSDKRIDTEIETAYKILELIDGLPLALQIVGATLQRQQNRSLADYAVSLERQKTCLENLKVRGDKKLNVKASLSLSVELLEDQEKDFFACLSACAEKEFARRTAMATGGCRDEIEAETYLYELHDLYLLNLSSRKNWFVLHPLIWEYAKDLAQERNIMAIAQERHARYFVEWLQSENLEDEEVVAEVAANLDDVILAAEWLKNHEAETEKIEWENYQFTLQLQKLFENYGYWNKANTLIDTFQSWAEQWKDWNTVVRFEMHKARYLSFEKKFEEAEQAINSAKNNLNKIENLRDNKRREAKVLNVEGGIFEKQGKTEEAIETFELQLEIDEEIGNDKSICIICNRLGRLLQSKGRFKQAEQKFKRTIEVASAINDLFQYAMGLRNYGELFLEQGKPKKTLTVWKKTIYLIEKSGDSEKAAATAMALGGKLDRKKYSSEALQIFLVAAALHKSFNSDKLIFALRRLANFFCKSKNIQEALKAISGAIKISREAGKHRELATTYNILGKIWAAQGNFRKAELAYRKQVKISQKIKDEKNIAIGLQFLLEALFQQGKKEEAGKLIKKVVDTFKKIENNQDHVITLFALAGLLHKNKKLNQSLEIFQLVEEFHENIGSDKVIYSLRDLARELYNQKNYKRALQATDSAIKICEDIGNQKQLAIVYQRLGKIRQAQNKPEEAKKAFNKVITISKELNNQPSLAIGLNCLGKVLQEQGETKKAWQYFEESIQISEDCQNWRQLEVSLSDLKSLVTKQKKYQSFLIICDRIVKLIKTENCESLSNKLFDYLKETQNILMRFDDLDGALQAAELSVEIAPSIKEDNLLELTSASFTELKLLIDLIKLEELLCPRYLIQIQQYFENQIKISEENSSKIQQIITRCLIGDLQDYQKQWSQAENTFRKCFDLTNDHPRLQAIICKRLGEIHLKLLSEEEYNEEKYNNAFMFLQKSIELSSKLSDDTLLAEAYFTMAKAYLSHQDFQNAKDYLIKSFDLNASPLVTHHLTTVLTTLNCRDEALEYCRRALAITPTNQFFRELKVKLEAPLIPGCIKFIKYKADDERWGYITPDEPLADGKDIYYQESFIKAYFFDFFHKGTPVKVTIEKKAKGWVATSLYLHLKS